ncbi:hypothetical protein [Mesorhizobium sp.]|nr:hypothetical protein [Mesorhizobium sp.]
MSTSERINTGMAYAFGGAIGVCLAVFTATLTAPLLRAVLQYLAPLF